MKSKILKFICLSLVFSMLTSNLVFADSNYINSVGSVSSDINNKEENVVGIDYNQTQKSEYSDELINFEDNETKVYATKASSFSVVIPKKVILDGGETNQGEYSVKVKGDISGNEIVMVEPDTSFYFKQTGKNDVLAIVAQIKTSFKIGDDLVTESNILDGVTITGTISVDDISAGSWVGTFRFNIALEHEIKSEELEPGLYDANGVMLCTWEESGIDETCSNARDIINSNSAITKVVIPESVTSIGGFAFEDCAGLTSITIPDSVTSIGMQAFRGCRNLTSITIPEGVASISYGAFYGCISLTSITIPDSVIGIEESAFRICRNLTSINIPDSVISIRDDAFLDCEGLISIVIPESVTSIGEYAFSGCTGLTSITIPNSVTSIGEGAFYYCSGLTTINYTGTEEQWNNINIIDEYNEPLTNATINYNYVIE